MTTKKGLRVALDIALTVMIVFEMFIQFTGEFLHEVIGIAFFVSVALHIALSSRWIKTTANAAKAGNSKMTPRRASLAVVGCLLALATLVLAISSIAISNLLSATGFVWPIGSYAFWATVHAVSAYALCGLVVVHLAMHWVFMASALRIPYNPARRKAIGAGVHAVAAVGAVALGVAAVNSALPREIAIGDSAGENGNAAGDGSAGGNANAGVVGDGAANVSTDAGADNASSSNASSANASSSNSNTSGPSSSAASGKSDRNGSSDKGSSNSSASGAPSGSSANASLANPSSAGSSNAGSSSAASANESTSDICTLCKKRCSLSAPKCDKPYKAGLI